MIEQAGIEDLARSPTSRSSSGRERDLSFLHHPLYVRQFGHTALRGTSGDGARDVGYLFGFVTTEGVAYIQLVGVRQGHRRGARAGAVRGFERRARRLRGGEARSLHPARENDVARLSHRTRLRRKETRGYAEQGKTRTVFRKPLGEPVSGAQACSLVGAGREHAAGGSRRHRGAARSDRGQPGASARAGCRSPSSPWSAPPHTSSAPSRDASAGKRLKMAIVERGAARRHGQLRGPLPRASPRRASATGWPSRRRVAGLMTRAVAEIVEEAFGPWRLGAGGDQGRRRERPQPCRSRAARDSDGKASCATRTRVDGAFQDESIYGLLADDPRASRPRG